MCDLMPEILSPYNGFWQPQQPFFIIIFNKSLILTPSNWRVNLFLKVTGDLK